MAHHVTFIYTGTTTTDGIAKIYYGLHIAQPGAVPDQGKGTTDGANAWSGGSLQTTVDIGGSGASSIQLAPAGIIPGEISGMKFNDVKGDAVRDADGVDNIAGNADDEDGLAGWTIFLDRKQRRRSRSWRGVDCAGAGGVTPSRLRLMR